MSVQNGLNPREGCALSCRSVRIGNYKVLSVDKILISEEGVQMKVLPSNTTEVVTIKIPKGDVFKVLAHFGQKTKKGKSMPFLFLYISDFVWARVGMNLKTDSEHLDVLSVDEIQQMIAILPTKITEENKAVIKEIFSTNVEEIEAKVANEMLARTSLKPKPAIVSKIPEALKCQNDEYSSRPIEDPQRKKLKCH